MHKAEKENV